MGGVALAERLHALQSRVARRWEGRQVRQGTHTHASARLPSISMSHVADSATHGIYTYAVCLPADALKPRSQDTCGDRYLLIVCDRRTLDSNNNNNSNMMHRPVGARTLHADAMHGLSIVAPRIEWRDGRRSKASLSLS